MMRPFWAAALLLCAVGVRAAVLDPPSLRCTSVALNGDVTLTWVPPSDPTGIFQQYDLFHGTAPGGPFALLGSVAVLAQTSYVDVGAAANVAEQYYYIVTRSNSPIPNTSVSSDTLSTLFLQVNQSVPLGSSTQEWTFPHVPPLATAADSFAVNMEYPIGTWSDVQHVVNTGHFGSQVVSICDDSLTFRIDLPDASGCISSSNLTGALFQDVTPPAVPVIVTVDVDTLTNQTVVTWEPSPQPDTDGYIIVLVNDVGNVIIDTIYGQFNTQFIWPFSDAGSGPESYTIAAIDTCWKGTPPSPNTSATNPAHTTVFLLPTYDKCMGNVRLDWSGYAGWPVSGYDLHCSIDGGAYFLLGTFGPTTHTYLQANVDPDRRYCYFLKAHGAAPVQDVFSNKACVLTDYPQVPQWNYLRVATVESEGHVVVIDSVDLSATARRYHLERTNNGEPWEEIASAPGGAVPVITFTDLDVLTNERSYTYRVLVDDSCGTNALASNLGTSILLLAESRLDGTNHLRWNGYVQWGGAVGGYTVHRSLDGGPFEPIAVNPPSQWEMTDDVRAHVGGNGLFCYYVEALEGGNPVLNAVSQSNIACAVQQEEVWIPNAFIAGGVNNSFKPVLSFVDVRAYELTIFNRWGQSIWSTADPDKAWDGRVDDAFVPQGVYAYFCTFQNGAGKKFERRGTVTFIAGLE